MDAIKHNKDLLAELQSVQKQAKEFQDHVQGVDHMDVVYLGLAIETVSLRIGYLENLAKLKAEAEKEARK